MDLLGRLFGRKSGSKKTKSKEEEERGKFMPPPQIPTDDKFLVNFKENGGKFLYCSDGDEVQYNFGEILNENDWNGSEACCFNENLKAKFKSFGLDFSTDSDAPFCLLTCEYLVANTGALLVTSNQIGEKKLSQLPYNFVVLAGTSQLIETLGEGLRGIKTKHQNLPSNITTIKNFSEKSEDEGHFLHYGTTSKNLYLLLLEDL